MSAYNPSQDLRTLVERLYLWGEKTIIAVAPAFGHQDQRSGSGGESSGGVEGGDEAVGSGSETAAAENFSAWLVEQVGGDGR